MEKAATLVACGSHFLLFEKIEWSADVDNVYLAKNDHRWVTFIPLKTINSDLHHCSAANDAASGAGLQAKREVETMIFLCD